MSHMEDPEEVLDLVDASDKAIGTIVREDIMKLLDGSMAGLVRAVGGFVMNGAGELWIPVRQAHKKIAPNGRDFSAGEHVGSGESYPHAMVRGFEEELALHITEDQLEYIGKTEPILPGLPYFHAIYVLRAEAVPSYSQADYASFVWISPQDLVAQLQDGAPAKEALLPAVELLIAHSKKE